MATEEVEVDLSTNTEEPPVLPPADTPPANPPPTAAAAAAATPAQEVRPEPTVDAAKKEEREEDKEVPPTVPGLSEMLNEWQLGGIPEDKQFFSTQVGTRGWVWLPLSTAL